MINKKRTVTLTFMLILLASSALWSFEYDQSLSGDGRRDLRSANIHFGGERYDQALPLYQSILEENPYHLESLEKVAGIYYELEQDFPTAYTYYDRIIEVIEGIFDEYERLQEVDSREARSFYRSKIRREDLEDRLNNAYVLRGNCWLYLFQQGREQFQDNNLEEALQMFEELYTLAPDSVNTLTMLGSIHHLQDDVDKALEYYEDVVELEPDNVQIRQQLASIYFRRQEYDNAIVHYIRNTELEPENPDHFFNKAICYIQIGDNKNAYQALQQVIELEPENLDALIYASSYGQQLGKEEEAAQYLMRAADINPEDLEIIQQLSFTLYRLEKYEDLLKYAGMWRELEPESTEALQFLYHAARQAGETELENKYEKLLREREEDLDLE